MQVSAVRPQCVLSIGSRWNSIEYWPLLLISDYSENPLLYSDQQAGSYCRPRGADHSLCAHQSV